MNNAIKVIDLLYEYQIRRFERNDSLRIKSKVNFKDILQFKIIIKVAILGILLCFTSVATLSIGLSIQTLKTSYDFNLVLLGVSVCLSYFIFRKLSSMQFPFRRYSTIIKEDFCLAQPSMQSWLLFLPLSLPQKIQKYKWLLFFSPISFCVGVNLSRLDSWLHSQA